MPRSHYRFTYSSLFLALAVSFILCSCGSAGRTVSSETFTTEDIWLNKGEQKIYGVLYRPDGIKEAAVYCYDFCGGGRASKSDGKTSDMSIFSEEKDLEAVVAGLKKIKGIKKGKVTLLGISQGGMVSALFAGDHPKMVEKLVLVYPALCIKDDWVSKYPKLTDMPEVVNSFGMQLGRAYVEGLYDLDVYGRIARYKGPVQIIHGDQDRLVPISYSEKAHEAYRNSAFKVMPGAGHGFRGKVQEEAIGIIKNFLNN